MVGWGDGAVLRRCVYSVLAGVLGGWSRSTQSIGVEMLSDSQSVPRVMNPRARKGVAVETLFVTVGEGALSGA